MLARTRLWGQLEAFGGSLELSEETLHSMSELGLFIDEKIHAAPKNAVLLLGYPLLVLSVNRALETPVARQKAKRDRFFSLVPDLKVIRKIGGTRALFAGLVPYTLFCTIFSYAQFTTLESDSHLAEPETDQLIESQLEKFNFTMVDSKSDDKSKSAGETPP